MVLGGDTGKARDNRMAGLIKKHLPRAWRGMRTVALVPGGPAGGSGAMRMVAANEYPLPRVRPAGWASGPSEAVAVATLVGANSAFALDAMDQGDATPDDEIEATVQRPPPETGWKIQLAATPSQSSAEDILNRALTGGGDVLASATPYTEPVAKAGGTLFRVRFGGFPSKAAARSACAHMKRQKFDCIALQ